MTRTPMAQRHETYLWTYWTQRQLRSDCAFAQFNQNLHCAHFLVIKVAKFLHVDNEESEQTARLRWAYISEGTFSHVAHQILFCSVLLRIGLLNKLIDIYKCRILFPAATFCLKQLAVFLWHFFF